MSSMKKERKKIDTNKTYLKQLNSWLPLSQQHQMVLGLCGICSEAHDFVAFLYISDLLQKLCSFSVRKLSTAKFQVKNRKIICLAPSGYQRAFTTSSEKLGSILVSKEKRMHSLAFFFHKQCVQHFKKAPDKSKIILFISNDGKKNAREVLSCKCVVR